MISKSAFVFKITFCDLVGILNRHYVFHFFNKKNFESKNRKEKKEKKKKEREKSEERVKRITEEIRRKRGKEKVGERINKRNKQQINNVI